MTQTLSQLRDMMLRYRRANGAGSVKTANAMVPEILELVIDYIDEATGTKARTPSNPMDDLNYFRDRAERCEARYGAGSPECAKVRDQLKLLEDTVTVYRLDNAQERRVFTIDTGRMPKDEAAKHISNIMGEFSKPAEIDLASLSEEDQSAYIEAQFRHQGITNNGARYTGSEDRVERYLSILKSRSGCAPCAVNGDGSSAIVDALVGATETDAAIDALVKNSDAQATVDKVTRAAAPQVQKRVAKKPTKPAK